MVCWRGLTGVGFGFFLAFVVDCRYCAYCSVCGVGWACCFARLLHVA